MKRYCLIIILLAISLTGYGQDASLAGYGCNTITSAAEMEQVAAYVHKNAQAKMTSGTDSLPLAIHIVGEDNGSGYYNLDYLFTVLCQLNERYAPVGFYFYPQWPIQYIDNSAYYNHNYWGGFQMMDENNIPGAANIYFVNDPSGACGYYSYNGDAIAIRNSCALPNSTTLTHELGHYFGLPHTFSGWENGNVPANPEKVTRGAGANCSSAGDLFCDTDADFLHDRWTCPYTGNQTDADGNHYHPDSSLYMSYSLDACMSRFSDQQKGRMQDDLYTQRPDLLTANVPSFATLDTPVIVYPADSVYANNKTIRWKKVPGAEYYLVKVSLQNVSFVKQQTLTADTVLPLSFLIYPNVPYKVTVTPLNALNLCRKLVRTRNFSFSNSTPLLVGQPSKEAISVYPNPADRQLSVSLPAFPGECTAALYDLSGRLIAAHTVAGTSGRTVTIPTESYPDGLYFLRVSGESVTWTTKVFIHH